MKVWVLRHTFLKEKINFRFFNIFYKFLKKNISFSEKITQLFCRLQSEILLHDRVFWQFSIRTQYICLYGKLSNVPKIAPSGLCKWQNHFFLKLVFWQIGVFTKYGCFNPSKWPQMPQKWVNTIPFGSGHTLGTLNYDLGPLFCCFITLFDAGGILDPPGAPWCPLAPPWTP